MANEIKNRDVANKVIRISPVVNDHLKRHAKPGDNPEDVLRRLLKLPPREARGLRS